MDIDIDTDIDNNISFVYLVTNKVIHVLYLVNI